MGSLPLCAAETQRTPSGKARQAQSYRRGHREASKKLVHRNPTLSLTPHHSSSLRWLAREMNGTPWGALSLRINWAKPITLPSQPMATKAKGGSRRTTHTRHLTRSSPADTPPAQTLLPRFRLVASIYR